MCLRTVTKTIANPSPKVVTAWKLFRIEDGKLCGWFSEQVYEPDVWYEATTIFGFAEINYQPGFHAILTKKDLRKYYNQDIATKVELREVHTKGTEACCQYSGEVPAIVARFMRITKKEYERALK